MRLARALFIALPPSGMHLSLDPRYALSPGSRRRHVVANRWMRHRDSVWMPREQVCSIGDQVVRSACCQRLDSQTRVGWSLGREQAAITNEQLWNVMRPHK